MIKDIYLLVGGEATRLRPLSDGIPKALLTIKERLLIDLILENLEESNLDNINLICSITVSYTHLTLPTNLRV